MSLSLEIKDLNFFYGEVQALKDINITIHPNKITALIGPSGCGKSTFLRTINRMNDLISNTRTEGEILLDSRNILHKDEDVVELRKTIGMVFQKPNPFPKTIYENVIYGPKRHGIKDKESLDELVETSLRGAALWDEVKDKLHNSAYEISGGQQQRLCIARVLAVKPEIILMDEPTSALDPMSTIKIEELMEELKKKYTVVTVTHNMQQAGRVSDYTAFFLNGELIEVGVTENIFYNPRDKRTEDYISGRFG